MDNAFHRFPELFAQMGLPSEVAAIRSFIDTHAPLAGELRLEDAPFWTRQQAEFLRTSLLEDADWAEVVDRLNAALRVSP